MSASDPAASRLTSSTERLTPDAVRRLARQARLQVRDDELEAVTDELEKVLGYLRKLQQLDTAGIPPMTHGLALTQEPRADEPSEPLTREEAVGADDEEYVRVPRVME